MENHSVKNGLLMGLATVVFSLLLYLVNAKFMLTWGSYAGFVITIYFMRKAVLDARKDGNGIINLGEAFKFGWLTYILGTVISTIFFFLLVNYIDTSLIDILRDIQVEAIEGMGKSFGLAEDAIQEQTSMIEDTNPFGISALALSLPVSFLFPGAVAAIIVAAILKKDDPQFKNL